MKKIPLYMLLTFTIFNIAMAESVLLKCQGSNVKQWNNCFGTYINNYGEKKYKYIGEFQNGKYDGQGVMFFLQDDNTYTEDHKYTGQLKNGEFHGNGIATVDGVDHKGIWINGIWETSRE